MSTSLPSVAGSVDQGVLTLCVLIHEIRDAQQSYRLRDEMLAILTQTQPRSVIIDAGQVRYIGSIGFLGFLAVRRQLTAGRIVLCRLSNQLLEMFTLCRLIPTAKNPAAPFETAETLAEARDRLASE